MLDPAGETIELPKVACPGSIQASELLYGKQAPLAVWPWKQQPRAFYVYFDAPVTVATIVIAGCLQHCNKSPKEIEVTAPEPPA